MTDKKESNIYAALGASSSKEGVHQAIGATSRSSFFASVIEDVNGDPDYYSLLHADGAGTKSIAAYIAFRETSDPDWFRSVAVDALVMNLDDVVCVNAFESLLLSNTIGRNRFTVPDSVVSALIKGYTETVAMLREQGINLQLAGGETADVGDLVRTVIVDSCLFGRVKKTEAISTDAIATGDVLIGLSSTGKASYETKANSGIGSNGITLARHALIHKKYAERYPEILDEHGDRTLQYNGSMDAFDSPGHLGMSVIEALSSPTRTYAPVVKKLTSECPEGIHGIIHCTGGGQTKICRFGPGKRYIKDSLYETPPIFSLIQKELSVPWEEMYAVFNMGHRMEIACAPEVADTVIAAAEAFNIQAKKIGYVEDSDNERNQTIIKSQYGEFQYSE